MSAVTVAVLIVIAVGVLSFMKRDAQPALPKPPERDKDDGALDDPNAPIGVLLRRWVDQSGRSDPKDPVYAKLLALGPASFAAIVDAVRADHTLKTSLCELVSPLIRDLGAQGIEGFIAALTACALEEEQRLVTFLIDGTDDLLDGGPLADALCALDDERLATDAGTALGNLEQAGLDALEHAFASRETPPSPLFARAALNAFHEAQQQASFTHADARIREASVWANGYALGGSERLQLSHDAEESVRLAVAIAGPYSDEDLATIRRLLDDDASPAVRAGAALRLGAAEPGEGPIASAAKLAEDSDPRVKFAFEVLQRNEASWQRLCAALVGDDAQLRALALAAVPMLPEAKALDMLDQLLLVGSNVDAIQLIGDYPWSEAAAAERFATLALSEAPPPLRRAATSALGLMADLPAAAGQLERLLARDTVARTRRAAIMVLGDVVESSAPFAAKLLVPDEPLLEDVLDSLSVLYVDKSPEVRAVLEALTDGDDARLKSYAYEQLRQLEK